MFLLTVNFGRKDDPIINDFVWKSVAKVTRPIPPPDRAKKYQL